VYFAPNIADICQLADGNIAEEVIYSEVRKWFSHPSGPLLVLMAGPKDLVSGDIVKYSDPSNLYIVMTNLHDQHFGA
jgi:hypothetical protein